MYKVILTLLLCAGLNTCYAQNANFIKPDSARFTTGNGDKWKAADFNDNDWKKQKLGDVWQN